MTEENKATRLSVQREKQALETDMHVIQTQQQGWNEQQHLLIERQCAESTGSTKRAMTSSSMRATAAESKCSAQEEPETNKLEKHLISPVGEGAVCSEPPSTC